MTLQKYIIIIVLDAPRDHTLLALHRNPQATPTRRKNAVQLAYSAYGFFFLCMKSFNFTYKKYKFEKIKTELKIKFGLKEINLP